MKIVITGAAGFIGSNLVRKLLAEGHEVAGIDNFSYGERRNIAPFLNQKNFSFIEGDIRDAGVLARTGGDVLVHLASQKIPRYSSALRTLEENSEMLRNVVRKSLQDNCKLVFASTSDVYGKNANIPFTEESDLVMGPTTVRRWAYALSKIYGEQYIIANAEDHNLGYTIVRFFGSYGPNQNLTWWGGPQSVFIAKALNNEPLEVHGDGKQTRTFTYIEDTVQGLYLSVVKPEAKNEIFNIAAEPKEEITIYDLAKLIWKLVRGEEDTAKINLIPYSTFGKYEDVQRRVPSIEKIRSKLGFQPTFGLEEGMRLTVEWQKGVS